MIRRLQILALAAGLVAAATPLFAHHSWPVDTTKEVTVKGTVTGYNWTNPHVMIGLNVQGANGKVDKWDVGGPSTARMSGNGWDNHTLKPGDVIVAMGYQFTDAQKILRLQEITMADGKKMFLYGR